MSFIPGEPPSYDQDGSFLKRSFYELKSSAEQISAVTLKTYQSQPAWRKVLIIASSLVLLVIGVLFIVYHETLLHFVVEYSDKWSQNPWSPVILASILFLISFPPLVGFSFTNTVVGALFGISFKGWFIIAFGSILGSVAAFILFRYVLKSKAQKLITANEKLYAFSTILRENNSYWLIVLIRLCPFPYSLTNGALAAIPGVSILNFALGSIISSPKLVLYLFVGQKIKDIGQTKDRTTRVVDLLSIVFTVLFLTLTGWILFTKTNERLEVLRTEREAASQDGINDLDINAERSLDEEFEIEDPVGSGQYRD